MPTLALVRHGHTDLSVAGYLCGTTDPPLSAVGREMAEAVAVRAAGERWVALYASPLRRTRETAEAVSQRVGRPVQLEADLREIAYGEWEGRLASEVRERDCRRYAEWLAHPGRLAPPGGESGATVATRASRVIETIIRRHPRGNILVVSHKATIRLIICTLLGIDLDLFRVRIAAPVGSFATVVFTETGPLLTGVGDTSHLPAHLREAGGG